MYLQERLNQVLMEKKKESRSGMEIMNLLQVRAVHLVWTWKISSFMMLLVFIMCVNRRKGGNEEHGMGRRLTMIFTRRLYAQ